MAPALHTQQEDFLQAQTGIDCTYMLGREIAPGQ